MKKKNLVANSSLAWIVFILLSSVSIFSGCKDDAQPNSPTAMDAQPPAQNQGIDKEICNPCNNECVSAHCLLAASCEETVCLDQIMKAHRLTELQYNDAITEYYTINPGPLGSGVAPSPLSITRIDIETLVNYPCSLYRIKYDLNEVDLGTHAYMHFYRLRGHTRPMTETNSYSISFFKALLRNANISEFRFSRGVSCATPAQPTMMIAAFNASAEPVYFGDLTDVIPVFVPSPEHTNQK